MNKKQNKLTLETHKKYGEFLRDIRNEIVEMCTVLRNSYAQTKDGNKAVTKLSKAYRAIDEARSLLEEELFKEYKDEATTKIYYGG